MPFDRKLARAESFSLGPSPLVNQFLSDKAQDSPVVKPPFKSCLQHASCSRLERSRFLNELRVLLMSHSGRAFW